MPASGLLERIDQAIAELQAIRDEVAAAMPAPVVDADGLGADDLAPECLLDTTSAQERFGYPRRSPGGAEWSGVDRSCTGLT
jgi:hypothetical protein